MFSKYFRFIKLFLKNKDDEPGEGAETENIENAKKKQKNRPTTAPPTTQSSKQEHAKRSEFEVPLQYRSHVLLLVLQL